MVPSFPQQKNKKRTDIKIAVLIQVMDELGFDRETIVKVSKVPQRTVSDIVNRKGYWGSTGEYNELRESYRFYLRKCILEEAAALGHAVLRRFEELSKDADFMTALSIANAVVNLASRIEDGR